MTSEQFDNLKVGDQVIYAGSIKHYAGMQCTVTKNESSGVTVRVNNIQRLQLSVESGDYLDQVPL